MPDINKIAVKITGDESGLKKATKAAQKDIKSVGTAALSMGDIIKGSAIGSAIGNMVANLASTIGHAITSELDSAFKRFDALNNYSKVMGNLRVSTADSSTSIAILDQKLRGLPTSLSDAALGVQRFTAANGNIQASTDMYLAFNNAVLAGGAAAETQATAMEQLIQAYSKGKADAQEWRALLIAMPAQLKQIAEAMGYTSTAIGGDFQTALNQGKISMNDFALTAIKLNKQGAAGFASFAEQAKGATGGVQTQITNMKIAIQRGLADIMNAIGKSNIAGFFQSIASAIGTEANYIAAFISIVKQAIAWLGALFGWGGSGSTDGIVEATGAASDNLISAGAGAAETADGLNDAAGAAKKLRKQLAGFDEMNVLQEKEPESGGGSGSGSTGGGTPAIMDYKWDTSGLDEAQDKIAELVKKIKDGFKAAFGEWDFDKIGKAIQKFAQRIQSFFSKVGKVAGEIWERYLRPFVTWAGNELLPAFLNAVGGAIEFLGSMIQSVWGFIQPFVDFFLVPIAKFTGGVIVSVLNAIGDALSWIAQNAPVCDLLAAGLTAVGVAIAGIKIQALISSFAAAIPVFQGFMAASGSVGVALMNTAASTTGVTSALAGAGAGLASFGSAVAAAAPVLVALTGIIVSLKVAYEAIKLQLMLNDAATKDYITSQQLAEQIEKRRTDGIEWQRQAMQDLKLATDELNSANSGLANAEISRRNAVTTLDNVAKGLNMTTEEAIKYYEKNIDKVGTLDDAHLKLVDAVSKVKNAETQVRLAEEERAKSQDKVTTATEKQVEAENAQIRSMMDKQAQQWAEKENWYQLANTLRMYSKQSHEFTLENGQTVKRTKEEMAWLVKGVADDMATSYKEWDKIWSMLPNSVKTNASKMDTTLLSLQNMLAKNGTISGQNFGAGVQSGIQSKNSAVYNAGYQQGLQGKKGFNDALRIKSPSRAMMESGAYFAEGAIVGIEKEAPAVISAAEDLGTAMVDAFNSAPKFQDLGGIDIADKFQDLTAQAQGTLELQNESTNDAIDQLAQAIQNLAQQDQRVTVKIGEETLIDKIVDGINNASQMRNQTVLNL